MFASADQDLPAVYGQSIGAKICLASVNTAAAVDMELFRFPFLRLLIFNFYVLRQSEQARSCQARSSR
jgi:hypothetical protein